LEDIFFVYSTFWRSIITKTDFIGHICLFDQSSHCLISISKIHVQIFLIMWKVIHKVLFSFFQDQPTI
jgi:hypothetical protein